MSQHVPQLNIQNIKPQKIAVITAQWNSHITHPLRDGAIKVLKENGLTDNDILNFSVPGAIELTFAARKVIDSVMPDAIIVIGCVIRGGTPHFDYVCQSVTSGVTQLTLMGKVPVIFGVMTVDCEQDAIDRAGGALGNKGAEAAEAALMMSALI